MNDRRREYATAKEEDVAVLRERFERGESVTRATAAGMCGIPDRRLRAAIAALREMGMPIVSSSDEGSTYRLARDRAEMDLFIDRELVPRIRHLERQARAMRVNGPRHLEAQRRLIDI